ncbi:hypothetical protein [Epilithonimonas lactis]|uniref:Uncharacterized protein n=1 Tax=Epilithonimonas lactis TaxID=421072 RepID=A0A085BLB4_9FLAO|nr:hypothetical protein [Epilithonimonas lactis]KFC23259.1 hypothetical protein IO89_01330 [Epilithonimonas lactis]SEQ07096.1 hypothetical protein SAMN04488097_1224 [Epilithonimonas lactis]
MKVKFGENIVVNYDGILINDNYLIEFSRLWETRDFDGVLLWDWMLHITEKEWVNSTNIGDFNTAFFFAQDLFIKNKPLHIIDASTLQTIYIQQQKLHAKDAFLAKRSEAERPGVINVVDIFEDYNENDFELLKVELF